MSIIERINVIRKNEGLNKSQFERMINKSTGYLNMLEKKGATPSVDILLEILKNFPDYNLNWILLGKGEMMKFSAEKSESIESVNEEKSEYLSKDDYLAFLKQKLEDKEMIIKLQNEKIMKIEKDKSKRDAG
ncbi:helix-turn-helix domain-containing protein [Aequorivita echinoideorum]|uniref:Helix-turn-helix domain-containing protein n=1 Tax=Aequorivita echinoideorum TaxID=1549647 RepID=A0ABS5S317_9FLAO|nr:helix-turn-helix domain-containing protein [Aequorivita echinoideorum]MBT0607606.1 helix-turn-helix domain-containing protein [Aequorivita echinoideorum]